MPQMTECERHLILTFIQQRTFTGYRVDLSSVSPLQAILQYPAFYNLKLDLSYYIKLLCQEGFMLKVYLRTKEDG